jgi:RNA polymerase-binding protein DksA
MIQDMKLQEIRQTLEEELASLLRHMEDDQAEQGQRSGANLDRDDLAHNYVLQEKHLAWRDVEQARLAQIKEALERIADGSYGTCASCGTAIAPGRLEIIPYATLCVRCQQEQDRN